MSNAERIMSSAVGDVFEQLVGPDLTVVYKCGFHRVLTDGKQWFTFLDGRSVAASASEQEAIDQIPFPIVTTGPIAPASNHRTARDSSDCDDIVRQLDIAQAALRELPTNRLGPKARLVVDTIEANVGNALRVAQTLASRIEASVADAMDVDTRKPSCAHVRSTAGAAMDDARKLAEGLNKLERDNGGVDCWEAVQPPCKSPGGWQGIVGKVSQA